MFSSTLAIIVVLAVGAIGPVLGRNVARNYNVHEEQFPMELLPENEYLIGEETPIYFLRLISGRLETRRNIIKNGYVTEQRQKFEKASTKFVNLSPEITPQIMLNQPRVSNRDTIMRPEILVIVDFDLYLRFDRDWQLIFPYIVTFWNAVDLKFRTLHSPSYRLNIAGIIIAETSDALSYINDLKFSYNGRDYVPASNSLDSSGFWLYQNRDKFSWSNYDIAVTMTSNLLCKEGGNERSRYCRETTFGVTYHARACHDNDAYRNTYKTAIIHNEGAYDRALVAAHTIGLLMGSGCNSPQCYDNYENVLTYVPQITSSNWTPEQVNSLGNFIKYSENFYCLTSQFQRGEKMQTYLPGKMMDANEQCQRMNFAGVYNVDPSICTQLNCVRSDRSRDDDVRGMEAADGTTCGPQQICLHSKCVGEVDENQIFPNENFDKNTYNLY